MHMSVYSYITYIYINSYIYMDIYNVQTMHMQFCKVKLACFKM